MCFHPIQFLTPFPLPPLVGAAGQNATVQCSSGRQWNSGQHQNTTSYVGLGRLNAIDWSDLWSRTMNVLWHMYSDLPVLKFLTPLKLQGTKGLEGGKGEIHHEFAIQWRIWYKNIIKDDCKKWQSTVSPFLQMTCVWDCDKKKCEDEETTNTFSQLSHVTRFALVALHQSSIRFNMYWVHCLCIIHVVYTLLKGPHSH